jgi:hypothetical protein
VVSDGTLFDLAFDGDLEVFKFSNSAFKDANVNLLFFIILIPIRFELIFLRSASLNVLPLNYGVIFVAVLPKAKQGDKFNINFKSLIFVTF